MKLRLQGNSLRLRLTRSEVARLQDHGTVEEAASFTSGGSLTYRIQSRVGAEPLYADFRNGTITVLIMEASCAWRLAVWLRRRIRPTSGFPSIDREGRPT